jgi:hypothetical protein
MGVGWGCRNAATGLVTVRQHAIQHVESKERSSMSNFACNGAAASNSLTDTGGGSTSHYIMCHMMPYS